MGKSLQGWCDPEGGSDVATADGSGTFASLLGHVKVAYGVAGGETDAGAVGHVVGFSGTIRKFYVKVNDTNTRINTSTFYVRVNSVRTTCICEVGAHQTGDILGTGSVDFIAGDYIDVEIVTPQQDVLDPDYVDDGGVVVGGMWCELETDTGHFDVMVATGDTNFQGDIRNSLATAMWPSQTGDIAGMDFFAMPIAGGIQGDTQQLADDTLETVTGVHAVVTNDALLIDPVVQTVRAEGTFSGGRIYVETNSEQTGTYPEARRTTTWGLVVNGVTGDPTYTVTNIAATPETIGWVAPSGTQAAVSGDEVCFGINTYDAPDQYTAGTNGLTDSDRSASSGYTSITHRAMEFESDDAERLDIFLDCNFTDGYVVGSGVLRPYASKTGTQYVTLGGIATSSTLDYFPITYADMSMPSCTLFSLLRATCTKYTSGSVVITVMVDGEATTQTITLDSAEFQEDATHTSLVGAGHTICLKLDFTAFVGVINGLAITQQWSDTCPLNPREYETVCPGAMSFAELKYRALEMLGEDPEAPVYWTEAEIGRYVNDAYIEAARETKALEYIEAVGLSADSEVGAMSSYVGQVFRATWDDNKIPNTTKWELDRQASDWEAQSGTVTHYVTTLQDNRTISTYKAWDGTAVYGYEHFYNDGAFTYTVWANATGYVAADRVTIVGSDGYTRGYACILAHTSATATNKPTSGSAWETYWVPLSLMLWSTKNPAVMSAGGDEPELPQWCHIGLAFRAAAKALGRYGEHRNDELAAAYDAIAGDYVKLLKGLVANRTPERVIAMGPGSRSGIRRPRASEQTVT